MKRKLLSATISNIPTGALTAGILILLAVPSPTAPRPVQTRDKFRQPFASTSIWNMPIGSDAVYVEAKIKKATRTGMFVDPDIIILKPDAPMTDIYYNADGWVGPGNRCDPTYQQGQLRVIDTAPVPEDFVVPGAHSGLPSVGETPNHAAAILMPNGRTLKQNQPFTRCRAGQPPTTLVRYPLDPTKPDIDIYGDGIEGAHGGSGLSSVGGTIRLGELVPGGTIPHTLKVNLYARENVSPRDGGFRWPAVKADSCAPGCYGGRVDALKMGALLAIHKDVDCESGRGLDSPLETAPAKIICHALQDYGAYVVDDSGWSAYAIHTEFSPDGNVEEEFRERWGFPMRQSNKNTPWARDMDRLFLNLYVIDNNGPNSIGGSGTPRRPLAPPIGN